MKPTSEATYKRSDLQAKRPTSSPKVNDLSTSRTSQSTSEAVYQRSGLPAKRSTSEAIWRKKIFASQQISDATQKSSTT